MFANYWLTWLNKVPLYQGSIIYVFIISLWYLIIYIIIENKLLKNTSYTVFLNISASAPTSFPRSDSYYQFGICHVITFAVFIYTYICTPIWFFSHTNGIPSHYFLTCFLYLINNMSCEYRSIVQNPEILNYAYFLQSTTLFCALTGKHLFSFKRHYFYETSLLWNLYCIFSLLWLFICFCLPI